MKFITFRKYLSVDSEDVKLMIYILLSVEEPVTKKNILRELNTRVVETAGGESGWTYPSEENLFLECVDSVKPQLKAKAIEIFRKKFPKMEEIE